MMHGSRSLKRDFNDDGDVDEFVAKIACPIGKWQWMATLVTGLIFMTFGLNKSAEFFTMQRDLRFECSTARLVDLNMSELTRCGSINVDALKCDMTSLHQVRHTIIEKWKLICERQYIMYVITIIMHLGFIAGSISFGILADKFGRKYILLISMIVQLLTGLISSNIPELHVFILTRFLYAACMSAASFISIIIVCEITGNRRRSLTAGFGIFFLTYGFIFLPFVFLYLKSYNQLLFIVSLPQLIPFFLHRFIPESPLWLLYKQEVQKAEKTLNRAALINITEPNFFFRIYANEAQDRRYDPSIPLCTNVYTMVSERGQRWKTVAVLLTWTLQSAIWQSSRVMIHFERGGDTTVALACSAAILSAIMAVLGFGTVLLLLIVCQNTRITHKHVIITSALCVLAIEIVMLVNNERSFTVGAHIYMFTAVHYFASIMLAALWNITPRMFPTCVRCTATGIMLSAGEIGNAFVTTFIAPDVQSNVHLCVQFLVVAAFLTAVFAFFVTDVSRRELPDTAVDFLCFLRRRKPTRWICMKTLSTPEEEQVIEIIEPP